ncbi:uncharacterized protein V6R79_015312 [Siganus canaliculatus]
MPMLFNLHRHICVDEQPFPFRGWWPKKVVQIWNRFEQPVIKTSYTWGLQVYSGKLAGNPAEVNQGIRVMTDRLQGHIITCDNLFTTFPLVEQLPRTKLAQCRSPEVNEEKKIKLIIIKDYNRSTGGVDNPDRHLVDVSLYNAYVL